MKIWHIIKYWDVCLDSECQKCITPCFPFKLCVHKILVIGRPSKLEIRSLKRTYQSGQMRLQLISWFLTLFILNLRSVPLF